MLIKFYMETKFTIAIKMLRSLKRKKFNKRGQQWHAFA